MVLIEKYLNSMLRQGIGNIQGVLELILQNKSSDSFHQDEVFLYRISES